MLMACLPIAAQKTRVYSAKPDMETKALQALIDKVSAKGGGRVVFAKGEYHTGQLELKSGVELHLEEGAVILGSTSPYDYNKVETKQSAGDERKDKSQLGLIIANNARNIAITGSGTIDGQGLALALTIDSLHHTGERIDPNYNQRRQRPSELVRPKQRWMGTLFPSVRGYAFKPTRYIQPCLLEQRWYRPD